jgi:hypothetical protein
MVLILVACDSGGGDNGDAPPADNGATGGVSSDATHTPEPAGFVADDNSMIIVSPQVDLLEVNVPLPGTLVHDSEFVDENMGAVFDRIVFTRTGGGDNAPVYLLKLKQDGTYELNRESLGQVDNATVIHIDDILDEINFFGINTPMQGPGAESAKYRYAITVERGGDELTLRAEDGFIPQEVMPLFGALMGVITNSGSTITETVTP